MTDDEVRTFLFPLSVEDGRTVVEALAELPFKYVFDLIGSINRQANEAVAKSCDEDAVHKYAFSRQEFELIVKALGNLPFNCVHTVLENLNAHVGGQKED